ncbi:MAG: D-glycero-alpha-D-manno-heptose-1,7-bisphosphate 7-phosphatase, partial [Phycisphaeraceae bacterium]
MDAAVFLDRDNTIIHNDGDLGDPAEVRLIQGAANAIASLCGLGYKIVVITNQGGVARGKYGEQDVHAVHERIRELVAKQTSGARIDAFYYCPYHPKGEVEKYTREHPDRKPQPGMLLRAAKDLNLDLSRSWMVGDAVRDVQAGAAAGTRSLLVRPDLDQLSQQQIRDLHNEAREVAPDLGRPIPDGIVHNLIEAVRIIAQRKSDRPEKHPPRTRWEVSDVARLQQDTGVDAASKPKPAGDPPPQAASSSATTPDRPPRKQRPFRPLDAPPLPERDEKPGPA